MLYERGYTRQDVLELFRFIDWVMVLPPDLEKQLQVEFSHYEEERKMRYVTTIERWAENRGVEQGLEQGEAKAIRERIMETLEVRFHYLPIYFTDGEGPFPPDDPGVKTLWVLSKPWEFACPWGKKAHLSRAQTVTAARCGLVS